jgi:hypothetical protein
MDSNDIDALRGIRGRAPMAEGLPLAQVAAAHAGRSVRPRYKRLRNGMLQPRKDTPLSAFLA